MATQPKNPDAVATAGEARKPMAMPEGGWPADEFTGKAGSFERDLFTGKRRRVGEPTKAAQARAPRTAP